MKQENKKKCHKNVNSEFVIYVKCIFDGRLQMLIIMSEKKMENNIIFSFHLYFIQFLLARF